MKTTGISGTFYGVGVGPGDRELMSVRADRLLRGAKHIAYFRKAGRAGRARGIIEGMLRADVTEFAMEYPVTTEIPLDDPRYNETLSAFYAGCAAHILGILGRGEDVVAPCEGDPFFYGSFMHLHARLAGVVPVEVVPAVTGMSGAWAATGVPITWGDDVLTVLMGTLPEHELARRMADTDALVVMKVGRNIGKVKAALKAAGRFDDAWIVAFATMEGESVRRLAEAEDTAMPYFSTILVHGQGRRP